MDIDSIIDSLIQEEWQEDIKKALKDVLPHAKSPEEALGALKQIIGELTPYQIDYAMGVIQSEEQ